MASTFEVTVPDIGDFKDVEVIEVLVKAGDRVEKEQPLIALESDKATMEIPSPEAGVVRALEVKPGDKVSQGAPILTLEHSATQPSQGEAGERGAPAAPPPPAAAPAGRDAPGAADLECDLLVLGAGPGGYSAAFRGADLGLRTVLVERYPKLGGVCLNVGCIPSKALLHTAAVIDAARALAAHGVAFGEPNIDLDKLRDFKDRVVGKLTGGLAAMAKARKVTVLQGVGAFVDPHHLGVETGAGRKTVRFASAVVAT
ncbi:MAG TPA: biotin/lipoyl-containing protein, partial [Burkholderiales bacterium]|nr:biotin/lipoyl-containing protein [Burkholderiales bacterium]